MKKLYLTMTSILLLTAVMTNSCKEDIDKNKYLNKVLTNLEQIKSATYFSTISGSAPGDTLKFNTYSWYKKEYTNPADTFIGSSFAWFQPSDTSKIYYLNDGLSQVYVDTDIKSIEIDSFKTNTLPFRPIGPPFFNYTKSIIKYALDTNDSISADLKDFGDSLLFRLVIYSDKQVEFHGKPVYNKNPWGTGQEVSKYDIWINKSNDLPFRYRRSMSHQTSWETCRNVELNNTNIKDFVPSKYLPPDFEISVRGKEKPIKNDLLGKVAPDWTLKDFNYKTVTLKDLKSKILIIQFTGIGCGPCHASIPFLKQLVIDNKIENLEIVSIETWSNNIDGIKRYCLNNNLNYKFLVSTEEVTKDYQVRGVPVFYILDESRAIRKIIHGYGKETTDKEIKDFINELI